MLGLGSQPVPQHQEAATVLPAPVIEAQEIPWTPQTIEKLAEDTARNHGIPIYSFVETMRKESMGFTVVDGQSFIPRADGPNGRENSWGICQIHLPDHPTITMEQAQDPRWCLEWAAKEFKAGRATQWTEYRKLANATS